MLAACGSSQLAEVTAGGVADSGSGVDGGGARDAGGEGGESGETGETGGAPAGDPCDTPLFIDAIASWTEVHVDGGGMDAIRAAIDASDLSQPTRITVAAGTYDGQCLYVEDHERSASAPLWIRADGEVQIDCTNGNGQAVAFVHSSYIAFDGFTIGPDSGYYADSAVHIAGKPNQPDDPAHYGDYLPSHHVIVRNLTARNLNAGPDGDGNPDDYESGCCDGVKSNQSEYVWVLDSRISRTARHGIDNVGVHHATICRNALTDMVGAGFAMEAKGGSRDIVFADNVLYRVRRRGIVLGGEGTDGVFMWPWDAPAEGIDEIAVNNVIVNAAEAGIGFYGCQGCAAASNSVWTTPGYDVVPDHEMLRLYASHIQGAGSTWGGSRRVGDLLRSQNNHVFDNLFGAAAGDMTCAMNAAADGVVGLTIDHNLWWNGGSPLADGCGTSNLSLSGYPDPASLFGDSDPRVTGAGTFTTPPDLTPLPKSPLVGTGSAASPSPGVDLAGKPRPAPPSMGALEP
jgi:hypothetical protein